MNSLCNTLNYILLTMFVVMPLPAQDFSVIKIYKLCSVNVKNPV